MKETLDQLIDAIPAFFHGKMVITMNPICYNRLCEEMKRKVKSYRRLKIDASDHMPENRICAHHSTTKFN